MKQAEVRAIWEKLSIRQGSVGTIMLSEVEEAIGEVVGIEGDEDFPESGFEESDIDWEKVAEVYEGAYGDYLDVLRRVCAAGSSLEVYQASRDLCRHEEYRDWVLEKRDADRKKRDASLDVNISDNSEDTDIDWEALVEDLNGSCRACRSILKHTMENGDRSDVYKELERSMLWEEKRDWVIKQRDSDLFLVSMKEFMAHISDAEGVV